MLTSYYPCKSQIELNSFFEAYLPLVLFVSNSFPINLTIERFEGDHLGIQTLDKKEFDIVESQLLQFSDCIHSAVIQKRRNKVFLLKTPLKSNHITIPKVEIFEPKPDADSRKLKAGVEHIAFMVNDYEQLLNECKNKNVPIDKEVAFGRSNFFKTKLVNMVEIDFRNDKLGAEIAEK
jgi:predicted metalloenzyme YecM